ncbi:MAG: hypothetical protein V7705_04025 [Leeuwenhoekiella marinoflava]
MNMPSDHLKGLQMDQYDFILGFKKRLKLENRLKTLKTRALF